MTTTYMHKYTSRDNNNVPVYVIRQGLYTLYANSPQGLRNSVNDFMELVEKCKATNNYTPLEMYHHKRFIIDILSLLKNYK